MTSETDRDRKTGPQSDGRTKTQRNKDRLRQNTIQKLTLKEKSSRGRRYVRPEGKKKEG